TPLARPLLLHAALPTSLFPYLLEVAIEQLFGELDACELEVLCMLLESAVKRHPDRPRSRERLRVLDRRFVVDVVRTRRRVALDRSEEHTSELQSRENLV